VRHAASRRLGTVNAAAAEETNETAREGEAEAEEYEEYDVVVVANGHYESPHVPPELQALAAGSGLRVSHSKDYDTPARFQGKRVVVVGSRASGTDVAREVAAVAELLLVVDRSLKPMPLAPGDGTAADPADQADEGPAPSHAQAVSEWRGRAAVAARAGGARGNIVRVPRLVRLETAPEAGGGDGRGAAVVSDFAGLGLEATVRAALRRGGADERRGAAEALCALPGDEADSGDNAMESVAVRVDEIIWCTGFNYAFPFLDGQLDVEGQPLVRSRFLTHAHHHA
jgi:cation diffusion facilitator CzcD-associated flavoprotein CzcO